MKSWFIFSLVMLALLVGVGKAEDFFQAKFMSVQEAEKRWGQKTFDANEFRSMPAEKRAPMAVDIVKRQLFVGQERSKVRQQLGSPDGYFFSDSIYAYKLDKFKEGMKEAWDIVFIPDQDFKKVKEVKIHKRCCYEAPSWAK
jgi:hypothetical protein